ncbi:MAG: hypothetical protein A2X36_10375 [Elusimicrobia bacterium GWA2_69_24]|nr:MAG: hypothetical protein A2X36_10375 [Elusimicrobia bacterium GWA2_69_24]HBL18276.1 hypothetical protein [Elusimicrobiota bacterium]
MADEEKPVEVGSFRVARERMLEILKNYQLPEPRWFGKSVLRAACVGGATRFDVSQVREEDGLFKFVRGVCGVEFRFDGEPLSPAELKDPFAALVQEEDGATARGRELAFGLVNALRLEPKSMTLTSGSGAGRVEVSIHNDLSLESRPAPGTDTGTVLRLVWGSLFDFGCKDLLGPVAPACRFPVVVDGTPWAYATDRPGLLGRDFEKGALRGRVRIPDVVGRPGRLDLFVHGVFAESVTMDGARVSVDGFADAPGLRLNLSQAAVVRDAAFDGALRLAGREGELLMLDEAAEQGRCMSGIVRELYEPGLRRVWNESLGGADAWMVVERDDLGSRVERLWSKLRELSGDDAPAARKRRLIADAARTAWLREAAVRLLGDFDADAADPLLAKLWAAPLLAAADGGTVKLEEFFALQRKHGRIPVTRKPGKSGGETRVWLACEEDSLFLSRMAEKERWTFSE